MVNTIIILAAGKGRKMWPYTTIRSKAMLPVGNTPVLQHTIESLITLSVTNIIVVASEFVGQFHAITDQYTQVKLIEVESEGSSHALESAKTYVQDASSFGVLFGDTLYAKEDLNKIVKGKVNSVFVDELTEHSNNWIACKLHNDQVVSFGGHFRNEELTHKMVAGLFDFRIFDYTKKNPGYFRNVRVGVGSFLEHYLEETINIMIEDSVKVNAVVVEKKVVDMDKPWHLLEANQVITKRRCEALKEDEIDITASIDESAHIEGVVRWVNTQ